MLVIKTLIMTQGDYGCPVIYLSKHIMQLVTILLLPLLDE